MKRTLQLIAAEDHVDDGDPSVLQLPNDADPLAIEICLGDVQRIDLNFPKFTDGRAFSQAYLLRRRLGFKGDIRATGDVLIDQLVQMQRSGFSSAVLKEGVDARTHNASSTASAISTRAMRCSPRRTLPRRTPRPLENPRHEHRRSTHQLRTRPQRGGLGGLGDRPGPACHRYHEFPPVRGRDPPHGGAREGRYSRSLDGQRLQHRATYRYADEVTKLLGLDLRIYLPRRSRAHREAVEGPTPALDDPRHAAFTEEVKLEPLPVRCARQHRRSGSPRFGPPTQPCGLKWTRSASIRMA